MRWSVRCTCSHLWINMGDRFASLSKHTARTHTHTANAARQSIASFIQFGANDDHLPPFNTHFSTYSDTQAHTTYIANWECENAYTQSTKKMVLSNRNGGDMRFSAFSRHAFHIDFSRWSALLFICICMCVSVWVVWLCMYEGAKWQTAAEAYRPDAPGTMHGHTGHGWNCSGLSLHRGACQDITYERGTCVYHVPADSPLRIHTQNDEWAHAILGRKPTRCSSYMLFRLYDLVQYHVSPIPENYRSNGMEFLQIIFLCEISGSLIIIFLCFLLIFCMYKCVCVLCV